ncbi:hypothetical protein VIGAN_04314200 [Vigna angularis var. angularis]|uniref:Uncharacterized protein n=1 Tax=Vigna angularis var. angularis TaxID=157739 RepID=A0A0S3RYC2_PHAAN|nr:hypothetical protein VIGAN_04314200 [Vigna angularis var. angularis]
MAVDEIGISSPTSFSYYYSSSGSFESLWSAILGLPWVEVVAICANLTLFIVFVFVLLARRVVVCIDFVH